MPLNEPTYASELLDFLGRNWGNLASVAGLIVAGVSAFFAERASTAARQEAQAHAAGLFRTLGYRSAVYFCKRCGYYHVGDVQAAHRFKV